MSLMWLSSFASSDKIDDVNNMMNNTESTKRLAKLFHLVGFDDVIYNILYIDSALKIHSETYNLIYLSLLNSDLLKNSCLQQDTQSHES